MTDDTFPLSTATVYDRRGFPRTGTYIREVGQGCALYCFPGAFIVGSPVELTCDAATASDADLLAGMFEEDGWTATKP